MQRNPIPTLNQAEFEQLCSNARLVEIHRFGPKVYIDEDKNQVIKLFYKKKPGLNLFSLLRKRKRCAKFVHNAKQLRARDITAPDITAVYRYETPLAHAHVIVYDKIPGEDLYDCLRTMPALMEPCIAYFAHLHKKGIFFRGIHLGNILRQDNDQFAVVDVEDCYFYSGNLSLKKRARNIAHVFNRAKDMAFLPSIENFMQIYFQTADLSPFKQVLLMKWLKYLIKAQT